MAFDPYREFGCRAPFLGIVFVALCVVYHLCSVFS